MGLSEVDLLSGLPYDYKGICTIKPFTLDDYRRVKDVGYQKLILLSTLSVQKLLDHPEWSASPELHQEFVQAFQSLPDESKDKFSLFTLSGKDTVLQSDIHSLLSQFVVESLRFDSRLLCYWVLDSDGVEKSYIDSKRYDELCGIIQQLLGVSGTETETRPTPNFKNEEDRAIWERGEKERLALKTAQSGTSDSISLMTMVGSFCSRHPSYNFTNVWSLTLPQFNWEFQRLVINVQFDAYIQRWAQHGTDPMDFSIWYKS